MKDIEIISWVKFNKPGLKEKVEEIAKQSDSEIRFIQNLRDTFDISLADAKEVANKFYKQ